MAICKLKVVLFKLSIEGVVLLVSVSQVETENSEPDTGLTVKS